MSKKRRHKPKQKKSPDPAPETQLSAQEQLHNKPPLHIRLTEREIKEIYRSARGGKVGGQSFWSAHKIFTVATVGIIIILLVIGIMIIFGGVEASRELDDSAEEQGYSSQ